MTSWDELAEPVQAVLSGMAEPWLIVLALVLTTFLLEDVAIAAGAALATQGSLSWEWAFIGVAGGIALGDLCLYALGAGARRVPWLHRRYIRDQGPWLREKLENRLLSAVLIARVVPGLRLLTYTFCGFLQVSLAPFAAGVALAVTLWTAGLFWLSTAIGQALTRSLQIPLPLAVALPVLLLALAFPLFRYFHSRLRNAP
jgi:membrane protein DedA with SNARE-associated domain